MKTKLTKDDAPAWYTCTWQGREYCRYWDGGRLRLDPCGMDCCDQYTNFRRLVEYVEPEIIEGGHVTLPPGAYVRENNDSTTVLTISSESTTLHGVRYIRLTIPAFPPREQPDPPKPELVLVRHEGAKKWALKANDLFRFEDGNWMPVKHAEIIKPTE